MSRCFCNYVPASRWGDANGHYTVYDDFGKIISKIFKSHIEKGVTSPSPHNRSNDLTSQILFDKWFEKNVRRENTTFRPEGLLSDFLLKDFS